MFNMRYYAGFHAHQRQRTGTVTPVVRGFKIDGDEGGRGHVNGAKVIGGARQWDMNLYNNVVCNLIWNL